MLSNDRRFSKLGFIFFDFTNNDRAGHASTRVTSDPCRQHSERVKEQPAAKTIRSRHRFTSQARAKKRRHIRHNFSHLQPQDLSCIHPSITSVLRNRHISCRFSRHLIADLLLWPQNIQPVTRSQRKKQSIPPELQYSLPIYLQYLLYSQLLARPRKDTNIYQKS